MEKVSNAAGAKLHDLRRRKDFDEMILPASPGRWLEPELSGRQEGGVAGHLNKLRRRGKRNVFAWLTNVLEDWMNQGRGKCTRPNCIPAQRSSLGPTRRGWHRT